MASEQVNAIGTTSSVVTIPNPPGVVDGTGIGKVQIVIDAITLYVGGIAAVTAGQIELLRNSVTQGRVISGIAHAANEGVTYHLTWPSGWKFPGDPHGNVTRVVSANTLTGCTASSIFVTYHYE